MAEPHFDHYRIGIRELLEAIGPDNASYAEALTLQQRLEENLDSADRFGDTPSLKAERARIIEGCNRLSRSAIGRPFFQLCGLPEPSSQASTDELFRDATRYQIAGDLGYALQLYRQVQKLDPTYPRIDATIAAVEQEMEAAYVDRYGRIREEALVHLPPPCPMAERYKPQRARFSLGFMGCMVLVMVVLLILLYLWQRGMLG
jgi:hypothetical protein